MRAGVWSWSIALLLASGLVAQAGQAPAAAGKAKPPAGPLTVASPNGAVVVTVATGEELTWAVAVRGKPVLLPSRLSMTLDGNRVLGAKPVVTATSTRTIDQILRPVVKVKRAEVRDRFNERRVDFAGNFALVFRRPPALFPGRRELPVPPGTIVQAAAHQ